MLPKSATQHHASAYRRIGCQAWELITLKSYPDISNRFRRVSKGENLICHRLDIMRNHYLRPEVL